MNTMRGGFTPYTRERDDTTGRRTSGLASRGLEDALATRKCGRTLLAVIPTSGTLHKLRGTESDLTGYALVALGNKSRETKHLGKWDTLDRACEAMQAYSPRYGLLK